MVVAAPKSQRETRAGTMARVKCIFLFFVGNVVRNARRVEYTHKTYPKSLHDKVFDHFYPAPKSFDGKINKKNVI